MSGPCLTGTLFTWRGLKYKYGGMIKEYMIGTKILVADAIIIQTNFISSFHVT